MMFWAHLFLWALLSPIIQASFGKAAAKNEVPAHPLHGEWVVVSLEASGYQLKGTDQNPMTVTFTNGRMIFRPGYVFTREFSAGLNSDVGPYFETTTTIKLSSQPRVWALRLHPGRSAGQIDLEEKKDDEVTRYKGIYRVMDGDLYICIGEDRRPKEFTPGTWSVLMRLKSNGGPPSIGGGY
jgi:uncharacterized protein (TIGR03067 family)